MVRLLNNAQIRAIRAGVTDKDLKRSFERSSYGRRSVKTPKARQSANIQRIYAKARSLFANRKLTSPRRITGMRINGKPAVAVPRQDGKFNVVGAYAQSSRGKSVGLAIFNESGSIHRLPNGSGKAYSIIRNSRAAFRKGSTGSRGG